MALPDAPDFEIDVQIEYLPFLADWFIERHGDQIDEIRKTISE